jgi:hypothetical protein
MRSRLVSGPLSAALIGLMIAGCLFLWVGVPVIWLWIGSRVQSSQPVGTALMVSMIGAIGTIVCVSIVLAWLNRKHVELREARGLPVGETSPLEVMLVVSAGLTAVGFAIWFLALSGSSPVPLNLSQ